MPRRYKISEERRKELSEQRAAASKTPETEAARSAYMTEFNKTTPEVREASSQRMTERHKTPKFTVDLLSSRWQKSKPD